MDYFELVGENVKRVLAAVEREGEECVLPEGWSSEQRHGEAAQRFREEFQKKSAQIDRDAREAIGALITGLLCDIHIIAVSLQPPKTLLEVAGKDLAPKGDDQVSS